jgi:hypothetical protein
MNTISPASVSRRDLSRLALGLPAPIALALLAGRTGGIAFAQDGTATPEGTPVLAPTPECNDDDVDETLAQAEGPYFTPNSPERRSLLEDGLPGTPLTVTGYVYSSSCAPVERALIEFWQCDDAGVYDNEGYRLRGHQFTDEDGRYELTTILPGIYPGRTRHIHVKVQAPGAPELTTQLYFPEEPENDRDGIFDPSLVIDMVDDGEDDKLGFFTFVVEA